MTEFTPEQKLSITTAAVIAAGPGADDGQVGNQVTRILNMQSAGPVSSAFERHAKRDENVRQTKSFTGIVLYADTETTSNRPIVFLKTEVSEHAPEGIELVRLDRLDSADGQLVRDLAKSLVTLVGHKVLVNVAVEAAGGRNVRVLRAVEDRGSVEEYAGHTNSTGWQLIDWENGGKNFAFRSLAPKLKNLTQRRQAALTPA